MNETQIAGGAQQVVGRALDAAGALTGDLRTQINGKARQAAGKAQSAYGDVLEAVEDSLVDRPLAVLALAMGVGFLTGAMLSRRR